MDINEICMVAADQIYDITKDYSREERLAFVQGMITVMDVFELGCKFAAQEEGVEVYPELIESFSQIKEHFIALAENL